MRTLIAILGFSTILLGACAHDRYARRECRDCHDRCAGEERACVERREADCGGRRRACENSCNANDWCR
jgi:hypothetical protein